jgi:hypothetical protein
VLYAWLSVIGRTIKAGSPTWETKASSKMGYAAQKSVDTEGMIPRAAVQGCTLGVAVEKSVAFDDND